MNTALVLILLVNISKFILASSLSLEQSFAVFWNACSRNYVVKAESYSTKDLFIWASYCCHKNLFTDGSSKRAFLFYPRPSKLGSFAFQFYKEIQKYSLKIIYHHDLFLFLICGGVVFSFIKWRKFKKCSGGRITLELVLKMTAP